MNSKIESKILEREKTKVSEKERKNNNLEYIRHISNKFFTYNKDINEHINSCKMSMEIIKDKNTEIELLKKILEKRDDEYRKLEAENLELRREKFTIEARSDIREKDYREVLEEQYKVIGDQDTLISMLKLNQKK